MDYIPVYEGDDSDDGSVKLSPGKIQRTGVKSEPAELRAHPHASIRAPGTIQLDERRVSVDRDALRKLRPEGRQRHDRHRASQGPAPDGDLQPRDLVARPPNISRPSTRRRRPATSLYGARLAAAAGESRRPGAASLPRSRRAVTVPITIQWSSPRDGIVLERNAVEGMRAQPGDVLFRIADHLAGLGAGRRRRARSRQRRRRPARDGASARLSRPDVHGQDQRRSIPQMNKETRTARVRDRTAQSRLSCCCPTCMSMPRSRPARRRRSWRCPRAPCSTPAAGRPCSSTRARAASSRARSSSAGAAAAMSRSRDGLAEGEAVVTSANFLIDAESNLKAALKGFAESTATQDGDKAMGAKP